MSDPAFRIAIIGSGPAGFYAADQLLRSELPIEVDLFDRLPTPHGLVRGGVAPDHPKIKSVTRVYDKTAAHEDFAFFGHVDMGTQLRRSDLDRHYHATIYAVGAQTDRRMGIPGEQLAGSHPATEFVGWYNGHPDYRELEFDLSCERAVVVGNGNVAMDVARILALDVDVLAKTDMADHALEALAASRVREIVVLGRRGPVQAAFTTPERREFAELADADVIVDPADLELDPASTQLIEEGTDSRAVRNLELLRELSTRRPEGRRSRIELRFCVSPLEIAGDGAVESLTVGHNRLVQIEDGRLVADPTGETERLACGLVLRSIGYRGVRIPGVPFDEASGTIPNDHGRVTDPHGNPVPGEYVVGWIKRGPSGIIGTNKKDAADTTSSLLADLAAGALAAPAAPDRESVAELLAERAPDHVTFGDWEAIDSHERDAGEPHGRPRVKLVDTADMVDVSRRSRQTTGS